MGAIQSIYRHARPGPPHLSQVASSGYAGLSPIGQMDFPGHGISRVRAGRGTTGVHGRSLLPPPEGDATSEADGARHSGHDVGCDRFLAEKSFSSFSSPT